MLANPLLHEVQPFSKKLEVFEEGRWLSKWFQDFLHEVVPRNSRWSGKLLTFLSLLIGLAFAVLVGVCHLLWRRKRHHNDENDRNGVHNGGTKGGREQRRYDASTGYDAGSGYEASRGFGPRGYDARRGYGSDVSNGHAHPPPSHHWYPPPGYFGYPPPPYGYGPPPGYNYGPPPAYGYGPPPGYTGSCYGGPPVYGFPTPQHHYGQPSSGQWPLGQEHSPWSSEHCRQM